MAWVIPPASCPRFLPGGLPRPRASCSEDLARASAVTRSQGSLRAMLTSLWSYRYEHSRAFNSAKSLSIRLSVCAISARSS